CSSSPLQSSVRAPPPVLSRDCRINAAALRSHFRQTLLLVSTPPQTHNHTHTTTTHTHTNTHTDRDTHTHTHTHTIHIKDTPTFVWCCYQIAVQSFYHLRLMVG